MRFELKPQLYGLEWADISMPTPYGLIKCSMRNGETTIAVPDKFAEAEKRVYILKDE